METGHANKSLNQTSGAQEGNGGESLAREGKQFSTGRDQEDTSPSSQ